MRSLFPEAQLQVALLDQGRQHWAFNFDTFTGKTLELAAFDSSCRPTPLFVSQSEFIAEARKQLKTLPADEYPNLTRFADYVVDDDAEGLFQFGLEVWLAGLGRLRRPS